MYDKHTYKLVTVETDGSTVIDLVENRDFCLPHLYSKPVLGGSQLEYCHNVWYGKTKIVSLPNGEKILKICLLVSTECTNMTDTQSDGQTCTTA